MIYLWHNSNTGIYEMGNEQNMKIELAMHQVTIVHEFEADEHRFAEKILTNLNRAAGEKRYSLAVA